MAQHDRPEDREPPVGGFGYLSSLGLDDDDGLDAAIHDADGEFGSPWRDREQGRPAHHLGTSGPGAADPTAGWALPDQEDDVLDSPSGSHLGVTDGRPQGPSEAEDRYPSHGLHAHDLHAHDLMADTGAHPHTPAHGFDDAATPSHGLPPEMAGFGEPADTGTGHAQDVGADPAAENGWAYADPDPTPAPPDHAAEASTPPTVPEPVMHEPILPARHDDDTAPAATAPTPTAPAADAPASDEPAPHDLAVTADPWRDEWQPETVGSRHPALHRSGGALGRSGVRRDAPSLTADTVLRRRAPRPTRGWRRAVYSASGGRVNLGLSAAEIRERELVERARTPLTGCHRLAVISLKGGVGKTTTTAALGSVLATLRGDRVIAVDANPDRGTLAERIHAEPRSTVRGLLDAGEQVTRFAEVRQFTLQATTRLEVLASDSDPGVSQAFSERDYRETIRILERFYNLILTDCGTGLLHSAMRGILGLADSLVIVSSASLDGARSASATLDWLEAHGLADVVSRAVTVISTVRPGGGSVDVDRLEDHFAHRCRSVVTIPYDPHLEAGGVLDLDELGPETRDAYYELAAEVGEGFLLTGPEHQER